jgi:outer membrane receptor protein involved in Fe transport
MTSPPIERATNLEGSAMKNSSIKALLACSSAAAALALPAAASAQANPAPPASAPQAPAQDTLPAVATVETDAIVVTGSRIVRDGFASPVPVTVVDAGLIADLGQTNAADVIRLVPQNVAAQSDANSGVSLNVNAGSQFANLRGLNPTYGTRTLTLVNTRRFVATSEGGQVDLNLIPSVMIGRVETVTGGASAAYGSDAVAGVVNIILDRNLTGLSAQVDYGQTGRGDGKTSHAAAAYGTRFADDRGHFMIGGEYQRNRGIEACFTARDWCAEGWTIVTNEATIEPGQPNIPSIVSGYNVPGSFGYGQPHYVLGRAGGLVYNSPFGVIRNFTAGAGNSQTAWNGIYPAITPPFAAVDKEFNADGTGVNGFDPGLFGPKSVGSLALGGDNASAYGDQYIQTPMERYTTYASAEFEVSDALTLFAEATYAERKANSRSLTAATRSTLPIKPDNAFLPASVVDLLDGNAFSLGKDIDDQLDNAVSVDATVFRGLAGASGKLVGDWTWDIYYQYGQNNRDSNVRYSRHNDAFAMALDAVRDPNDPNNIICRPLDQAVIARFSAEYQSELNGLYADCRPLNVFGTGDLDPAAVAFAWRAQNQEFRYRQHVVAGTVQGTLLEGWAGPISMATGVDYRKETGNVRQLGLQPTGGYSFAFGADYSGEIEVIEGFAETNVPVFRDFVLGDMFELNGAIRYTRNKSTDTLLDQSRTIKATSWKVGGIYDVFDGLRLRATQSRDIRAAGFRELFQKTAPSEPGTAQGRVNNFFISGPNPADNTPIYTGGNFTLAPEKADTTTIGALISPAFLPGFRVSLDWYQIGLKDAIANLSGQRVADLCTPDVQILCDRITFAGSDRTDIVRVDAGQANVGSIDIRGFDFEASYRLPLSDVSAPMNGNLDLRFLLNHQYDFIVQQSAISDAVDYGGQSGPVVDGGDFYPTPKWMWNAIIGYSTDRFNVTATVRHIGSGILNVERIGPEDPGYDPTVRNSITTNRVDSATYLNLAMSYQIPLGVDDDDYVEVFGTIENLFDKRPPIAPGGGVAAGATAYPTNPVYFDTFGMRWRAGARIRF